MASELIVVLDVDTCDAALDIVDACGERCRWFKTGAQLFTRAGPAAVHLLRQRGKNVFLDLKYHDIPNTVGNAARAAADLGASLITIHASGGARMVEAARDAVTGTSTRILAVTILTSLTDAMLRAELGIQSTAQETVVRLAKGAVEHGAHGVVCSPRELEPLRAELGAGPVIATPGIRPAWASKDDQARIMTPRDAAEAGADFVIVGRPILKHADPAAAVGKILEEIES